MYLLLDATRILTSPGYVTYRLLVYPLLLSPLRTVAGPPLGHPILGQLLNLYGENISISADWFKKYGPVVRVMAPLGMERLLIQDPEIISEILVKDWKSFPRVSTLHLLSSCNQRMSGDIYEHNAWTHHRAWPADSSWR